MSQISRTLPLSHKRRALTRTCGPGWGSRVLKLLNDLADAGSMFCWHRWRVIQVSPHSAYEKCMRCCKHRYPQAREGGRARPTGRRSGLFPPF